MATIRVVVIPADPDQPIEERQIDRGYKAGQQIVGGLIQPLDMDRVHATVWSNEEGLMLKLPPNGRGTALLYWTAPEHVGYNILVGDVFVTGLPKGNGDTTSVPDKLAAHLLELDSWLPPN